MAQHCVLVEQLFAHCNAKSTPDARLAAFEQRHMRTREMPKEPYARLQREVETATIWMRVEDVSELMDAFAVGGWLKEGTGPEFGRASVAFKAAQKKAASRSSTSAGMRQVLR